MAVQRKVQARLIKITEYGDSVFLYSFKPLKRLPRFKPGQFLHLAIDEYDPSYNWPDSRVFSIASSPEIDNQIDILVSTVGTFTKRMHQELSIEDIVWLKLPYGNFNFSEAENRDCVLIAGGTGISPFIAFLNSIEHRKSNTYLAYGVKSVNLIIIENLIKKLKSSKANFISDIYIEEGNEDDLNSISGRMQVVDIIKRSKQLNNPIYFLSGPPAMIQAFKNELLKNNITEDNIKFDNWE